MSARNGASQSSVHLLENTAGPETALGARLWTGADTLWLTGG